MAKAKDQAGPQKAGAAAAIPSAEELHKLSVEKEMAKAAEAMRHVDDAEEHKKQLIEQLTTLRVNEQNVHNFVARLKQHAEAGETELLVLRFPNELCTDRGRAINNAEPDWPDSLTGFPRDIYEKWNAGMRDRGYRLTAKILEFPGGMLGDVGLFVGWG